MQLGPGREVQMAIMAAMVPMMPMMMVTAPVMMPVPMMAVMPVSMMAAIPSVVAHLDNARVRQPGQPGSHAEIGRFGWFWRLHEHTEAKSESEYYSPEHVFLLNDGTSQAVGRWLAAPWLETQCQGLRIRSSLAHRPVQSAETATVRPAATGGRPRGGGPDSGGGSRPHFGAGAGGCGDAPGWAGAWGTAFCGGVGGCDG